MRSADLRRIALTTVIGVVLGFLPVVGAHAASTTPTANAKQALERLDQAQAALNAKKPGAKLTAPKPIAGGKFYSPLRADGTLTEWARKVQQAEASNGNAAAIAGDKNAEKIQLLADLLGKKAKGLAKQDPLTAAGGWDAVKAGSDAAFNTADELAVYLQAKHRASSGFGDALGAAFALQPELAERYEPAVKAAMDKLATGASTAKPSTSTSGTSGSAALFGAGAASSKKPASGEVAVPKIAAEQLGGSDRALGKPGRVAVVGFRLAAVIRDDVAASLRGSAAGPTEVVLDGVDYTTFQELADAAYDEFLVALQSSGRELVSPEELAEVDAWGKLELTPSDADQPYVKDAAEPSARRYLVVSPSGLPLWWEPGAPLGDKDRFAQANQKANLALSYDKKTLIVAPTFVLQLAALSKPAGSKTYKAELALLGGTGMTQLWNLHATTKTVGDAGYWGLTSERKIGGYGATVTALDAQTLMVKVEPKAFRASALAALRGASQAYLDRIAAKAPR